MTPTFTALNLFWFTLGAFAMGAICAAAAIGEHRRWKARRERWESKCREFTDLDYAGHQRGIYWLAKGRERQERGDGFAE